MTQEPVGGQADERLRRWRLVLGGADASGAAADGTGISLGGEQAAIDAAGWAPPCHR